MNEKVLVMFSGGLDSLLTTCKIIENGYKAVLVHYDNGCSVGSKNACTTVSRLIERYGEGKVEFWGIGVTSGYFYSLKNIYLINYSKLINSYQLTLQQVYCLSCRTAMYIFSILLCKQLKINKIAEGTRKSQLFVIEQEPMLEEYKKLLGKYGIELLLPVLDLESDQEREESLLIRQITPKVMESKCLLGTPMLNPLTPEEIDEYVRYFQNELFEPTLKLIKESEKIPLNNQVKMF